jgi:thiol-disulfide isomerase/thioredoxin
MVSFHAALAAILLSNAGQQTMLLDFYADWCGPCRAMQTTIHALEQKGYPIQKINIDQRPDLAARYGVKSVPCYVMLLDGKVVDRVEGGTTFSRLERMFPLASASGPPGANPADSNASRDAKLLAASVRLRVEDPSGHSCGSGTLIDSREGEALILTCGHLFRDSQGKGRIEVDLFGPDQDRRVEGKLVAYDLNSDVGLVSIRVPGPLTTAPLAPVQSTPQKGDEVLSVGCDNGTNPSLRRSRINSVNRYLTSNPTQGPANLSVAGQPTEGRSGGGLFSTDGQVIGVCNFRDPQDQEGGYAALGAICSLLDQAGISFVYQSPSATETPGGGEPAALLTAASATLPPREAPAAGSPAGAGTMPSAPAHPPGIPASYAATAPETPTIDPTEQAALEEIRRHLKDGAEVVCVIRPRNNPQARSEVIMLDKASPEFLRQLTAEARSPGGRHLTSLDIARPRNKILEWSAPSNPGGWQPAE